MSKEASNIDDLTIILTAADKVKTKFDHGQDTGSSGDIGVGAGGEWPYPHTDPCEDAKAAGRIWIAPLDQDADISEFCTPISRYRVKAAQDGSAATSHYINGQAINNLLSAKLEMTPDGNVLTLEIDIQEVDIDGILVNE